MKCPHCIVEINPNFKEIYLANDKDGYHSVFLMKCPNSECDKLIIEHAIASDAKTNNAGQPYSLKTIYNKILIRPLTSSRPPVPIEVDEMFSKEYSEACLILSFSPKASAALSRRCLQNILREKAQVKKGDLANEIQQVIDSKTLPTHLSESIDAIRNLGNFAAHPVKSKTTGEIVEVEYGESEWLLDVLESLFDYYFVQPAKLKAKRDALNKKLIESGKPEMK